LSRRARKGRQQRSTRARLPADPRRIDWAPVDLALARFDSGSLACLLAAAADSPGVGHRLPTLTLLWLRCMAHQPAGSVAATAADLPGLLAAGRRGASQLAVLEDCWPADPRLVVCYPLAGQRVRVHPGLLTDPLLTLRSVTATAEAIDEFVVDRHGFGLSDLAEVGLRYGDHRMRMLADAWPADGLARDKPDHDGESMQARVRRIGRAPVVVTEAEIAAIRTSEIDPAEWITACVDPARAAAAWGWATRPGETVILDLMPGTAPLGAVLAVESADRSWPVPASLVVSALGGAATVLAREAAGDQLCARRLQELTVRRGLEVLGHAPQAVAGPDPGGTESAVELPGEAPVAVFAPGSRHAFVIGFGGGLDQESLARSLDAAWAAVDAVTVDMVPAADSGFDASGSVFRVVVYGGPVHALVPARAGRVCVHVEDMLTAALDADQAATGESLGRGLLWQFLDELVSMPGVQELAAWDFADIWRVWQREGVLNPSGREAMIVQLVVIPDEESWQRAAAWEPLETVLTAAGLPASWQWSFAHLDEAGQATVGRLRHVLQLLAEPPLIVSVGIEDDLASLGIDPAFAVGVAEGIRQTAQASPGVSAVVSTADGAPLVCHLRVDADRPEGAPPDAVGCRLAAASGSPPVIDLEFGADWLELLAQDPSAGHAVLGQSLAEGLRQALELTEQAREDFVAAWQQAVPVATLRRAETALPVSFHGRDLLPRSPATAARARRAIAQGIVHAGAPPRAIYVEAGAVGVCTDVIRPAADTALAEAIRDWSPVTVLRVARFLNDAHANRARRAGELALALTAPWGPHWQRIALDAVEPAMLTRPLELLLESLLARTTTGNLDADAFDIAEAADLGAAALDVSLALAATRHRLHDLAVKVDDDGQFAITDQAPPTPAHATIDVGAYLRANRAHRLRLRPQALTGTPGQLTPISARQSQAFTPLHDLPVQKSLLKAEKIMVEVLGTGSDGLRAVLGTAVTWTPGSDDVTETTRAELRDAAITWSQLPAEQVDAALDLLILTPANLREEGLMYWEQERRIHRLATRPLINPSDDRLIIIPRRIAATQDLYAGYLSDGRLPWPPSNVPRKVADAFNDFRGRLNRELELQALQVVQNLGLPVRGNIEPHQAAPFGLIIAGEIDVLAADPDRSRLWVCEVKDSTAAFSPLTMATRIARYTEPDGYLTKLLRKLHDVRANPAAAARLLGASDPDRDWLIHPLMITRQVEPAAFIPTPAVAFTTIEDLAAVLQAEADPWPGG
jgi:hypothetical protein